MESTCLSANRPVTGGSVLPSKTSSRAISLYYKYEELFISGSNKSTHESKASSI